MRRWAFVLCLCASCDSWPWQEEPTEADTDTDTDADSDTDVDTDTDTDADADAELGVWTVRPHPCVGNRTDALLVEDGGDTLWVGCGTTIEGVGLYRSTDGGVFWQEVEPARLGSWRVNDLHRGNDGLLYIAGVDRDGDGRVATLSSTGEFEAILTNEGQLWNAMVVGSVRRSQDGEVVAESLNGTDVAFRAEDDVPFRDAWGWWTSGDGKQILDLEVVGNDFFGVGSTIASPPVVFLPPDDGRTGFEMTPVELSETFEGELWDIHVQDGEILVAGVNQTENFGVAWVSRDDPYDPDNWRFLSMEDTHPGDRTWLRGICRAGDWIVAVGENSITYDGIVMVSGDTGRSWSELPLPADTRAVSVCVGDADGTFRVAGADGFFAIYEP